MSDYIRSDNCNAYQYDQLTEALSSLITQYPVSMYWFREISSTSDWVKTKIAQAKTTKIWIAVADQQTQGRGTRGRVWQTVTWPVLLTVAIPYHRTMNEAQGLTLGLGVHVATALSQIGIEIGLKWPNDLWIRQSKCGGILCEACKDANGTLYWVIGIGLNLAMDKPLTLLDGYSAQAVFHQTLTLQEGQAWQCQIVTALVKDLVSWVSDFGPNQMSEIVRKWPNWDVMKNQLAQLETTQGVLYVGRVTGITAQGYLQFQTSKGNLIVHDGRLRPWSE